MFTCTYQMLEVFSITVYEEGVHCSVLAPTWTLFTFVPFDFQTKSHAIYFGNEMGGKNMYRLWLLKLCNLHKFFYLSVSVQLI